MKFFNYTLKSLFILICISLSMLGIHQSAQAQMVTDIDFTSTILFSTKLTGGQEVPAVSTSATGVGGFLLNATRDSLHININVDGLSGPITGIHIHEAPAGANGPVVTDLSPFIMENKILTSITTFDLDKFWNGQYYLNVHTAANPNGEIRGQITPEAATTYLADLNGLQEVPPVTTTAFGRGIFNLSKDQSMLEIRVVATGLSGPITGAHLHVGAMGANGGVVQDLTPSLSGNSIEVTVDPSAYLSDLTSGNIYINIHTSANPNGEIRGQLDVATSMVFDARLTGAQEVPSVAVMGTGVAAFWMSADMTSIMYDVVVDGLTGPITGAHIHNGAFGTNGGVDVDLTPTVVGNRIMGTITGPSLTSGVIDRLITGDSYLNVHTAANPSGEIRGQIYRLARNGYTFDVCGEQEVPASMTDGYGGGILSTDRYANTAHIMFTSTRLTGPITAAHIHNAARGMNGGVLYDLGPILVDNSGFVYEPIDQTGADLIFSGATYLNIHTAMNPGGELRGQIDNMLSCPMITTSVDQITSFVSLDVYPSPVSDILTYSYEFNDATSTQIRLIDMSGRQMYSAQRSDRAGLLQIQMNDYPSGLYILEVINQEGNFTKKVVKQ